jgi:hypothetical protein
MPEAFTPRLTAEQSYSSPFEVRRNHSLGIPGNRCGNRSMLELGRNARVIWYFAGERRIVERITSRR